MHTILSTGVKAKSHQTGMLVSSLSARVYGSTTQHVLLHEMTIRLKDGSNYTSWLNRRECVHCKAGRCMKSSHLFAFLLMFWHCMNKMNEPCRGKAHCHCMHVKQCQICLSRSVHFDT